MKQKKHGVSPPRAKSLRDLGRKIANCRYDAEKEVIEGYLEEKRRQQLQDGLKHRRQLSHLGAHLVRITERQVDVIERMLKVSEPHMRDDLKKRPLPPQQVPKG